jgi:hypothetical protein
MVPASTGGPLVNSRPAIFKSIALGFFTAFCVSSCITKPAPLFEPSAHYKPDENAITIMSYNVENLFDTEDDVGKKDETYLPLAKKNERVKAACRVGSRGYYLEQCLTMDWSEAKLARKLERLTDVLKKVRSGKGPDVLILQEVENINVLEIWRKQYLAEFNYKPAILLEGPDERGIDVGVLTRLEVVGKPKLHIAKFVANKNLKKEDISETRGILETTLKLDDGSLLTVLAVHLPSQSNPSEMRKQSLENINKIKSKLPKDRLVVVGGDFNISSDEEVKTGFYGDYLNSS